jgi:hypothetical protein
MGIDMGVQGGKDNGASGSRMFGGRASAIRVVMALLVVIGMAVAAGAAAHVPTTPLAALEVYDRHDGAALPVWFKDGERYVVGTPGHEYALRVRNLTGERILAVMSVDGVNIVSGETAAPDQVGYVLDPYQSAEIDGWRKSLSRAAAFYFTDLGDSYAARTGRPDDVGVIGLAVFRERLRVGDVHPKIMGRYDAAAAPAQAAAANESGGRANPAAAPPSVDAPDVPLAERKPEAAKRALDASPREDAVAGAARRLRAPLGTGHGRIERSFVTEVAFERATSAPAFTLAVRYDRRENLVAMGVLPGTAYAERRPHAFPGARFVPDP